jgi:2-C-methyl-D-erythritol 4-phosphate cytidylyltransferase
MIDPVLQHHPYVPFETVIIVAGGTGQRMGNLLPKQFIEILGKPILLHTIERFLAYNPKIELIIGLPNDQFDFWKALCIKHGFDLPHQVVKGGASRFETVLNCLGAAQNTGIIAVHDSVRPCVDLQTIQACFATAREKGAAIPVVPLVDSIRQINPDGNMAVDRGRYVAVQTPQVFRANILIEAYKKPFKEFFTDDASVVEHAGHTISLEKGNRGNLKVTNPEDLILAEYYLKHL